MLKGSTNTQNELLRRLAASKNKELERISRRKKREECFPSIELVVQQEDPVQDRLKVVLTYVYSNSSFAISCTHKYRYPIRIG